MTWSEWFFHRAVDIFALTLMYSALFVMLLFLALAGGWTGVAGALTFASIPLTFLGLGLMCLGISAILHRWG